MKVEAAVYPGKTQQTDALPCKIRHCFGGIHGLKLGSGMDGEKVSGGIQSCKGFDVGKSCIRREGLRMTSTAACAFRTQRKKTPTGRWRQAVQILPPTALRAWMVITRPRIAWSWPPKKLPKSRPQ